jgi:RNA polymerase sigma factor (sigma-70 family)
MAGRETGAFEVQIRTLFTAGTLAGLSDRQLLERYAAQRDASSECAFRVLLERHGPMVLGVCRRILVDAQDVDDAFQATFLVLIRKIGSLRVDDSLGRWLFSVATRVALRARDLARRRRTKERSGLGCIELAAQKPSRAAAELADLSLIIAEELGKLPAKFQAAVVICDLEGTSHEEAAQRLGWPVGTVKSRLFRARSRLRRRLTQRGLAPADLSLAILSLKPTLPASLAEAGVRLAARSVTGQLARSSGALASVTSLSEGVLRAMFWSKLKLAAVGVLVLASGAAVAVRQASAQRPPGQSEIRDRPLLSAQAADQSARDEAALEVVMLERAWIDAIPRRDAAVVNRIVADDFVGIDPVGNTFTKATYMPDLRNGVFTAEAIKLDEISTRVFGDTAVITGRMKMSGPSPPYRITDVYVKRQGLWQCLASHACWIKELTQPGAAPPVDGRDVGGVSEPEVVKRKPAGDRVVKIRPRFECLVEALHVHLGQTVKIGDPLLDLFSTELASAKIDYRSKEVQWNHDRRLLELRTKLYETKSLPQQLLVDTQNDEEKSRLDFQVARAKLKMLGLDDEAIERLGKQDAGESGRFIRRSPVAGKVIEVRAVAGELYDTKSLLMVIEASSRLDLTSPAR